MEFPGTPRDNKQASANFPKNSVSSCPNTSFGISKPSIDEILLDMVSKYFEEGNVDTQKQKIIHQEMDLAEIKITIKAIT